VPRRRARCATPAAGAGAAALRTRAVCPGAAALRTMRRRRRRPAGGSGRRPASGRPGGGDAADAADAAQQRGATAKYFVGPRAFACVGARAETHGRARAGEGPAAACALDSRAGLSARPPARAPSLCSLLHTANSPRCVALSLGSHARRGGTKQRRSGRRLCLPARPPPSRRRDRGGGGAHLPRRPPAPPAVCELAGRPAQPAESGARAPAVAPRRAVGGRGDPAARRRSSGWRPPRGCSAAPRPPPAAAGGARPPPLIPSTTRPRSPRRRPTSRTSDVGRQLFAEEHNV